MKSVLLIIPAQNFNEEEYLIISKALEGAGIKIFIASDSHFLCVGSKGMKVIDQLILWLTTENGRTFFQQTLDAMASIHASLTTESRETLQLSGVSLIDDRSLGIWHQALEPFITP